VRHRDVADQFHQRHSLAHAGAAEQADLAALGDRHDQVDHLDAGFQNLNRGGLVGIRRRLAVDRHELVGVDRTGFVDRGAEHIHDAAQRRLADRNHDRVAGCEHFHAATQAVSRTHRDGTNHTVAQLLLDFHGEFGGLHFQRFKDPGHGIT